jgi:sarcosine oxidase subunit alpha
MNGRLPEPYGVFLDRSRPLSFTFEGKSVQAFAGDTIASALLAGGRSVLSRSFKYHRPRGVLGMAGHDVNAFVQVGSEPNVRGDRRPVSDGLIVTGQNYSGSLDNDRYAALGALGRFLPVGFYYKTFFRPSWKLYEPAIRKLAGLGRLDPKAHHGEFDKAYDFCDVAVIGGGPAGMAAAAEAARGGAETLLIDEWPMLGGSLLYDRIGAGASDAEMLRRALQAELDGSGARVMTETTVSGLFEDDWIAALCGNRLYKIRARQVVLAAGQFDLPAVFRNNDLPGIIFASAAQRLMRLYGVKPGTRAVVLTANEMGYAATLDLLDAGVEIAAVADLRAAPAGPLAEAVSARAVAVRAGTMILEAHGRGRIEAVTLGAFRDNRASGQSAHRAADGGERIACDLVVMSTGVMPASNLAAQLGGALTYDPQTAMHRLTRSPTGVEICGSANQVFAAEAVVADGRRAGALAAANALGRNVARQQPIADPTARDITHPWPIVEHPHGKDFVDFDEDLQVKDIRNSVKDGYDDIQLIKRYSTLGMGPSQGRHSNVNGIRIAADATRQTPDAVGTPTFRPPLVPEKFGHMAGRAFEPVRLTAMHDRHVALGAELMPAGLWLRPACYGPRETIPDEVAAVRSGVGMIDVSTLGGLDIRGPDAARFVDRMYTWAYANQPVGRARYALMCDQTGVVIDDGVACRLHQNHFYVTATTGAVDQVYRQMTWWNAQWRLDVDIANVTAGYAGVNLAGPRSRDVLAALPTDIDLSAASFPYMGVRTGELAGIPVRILRVGFVGELGFEIHAPSEMGEALWDALMAAGQPFGIRPFGVEAQRIMRLEKGHIIIGQDTDGLTHPGECGMEWALAKKKPFYVGKRSVDIQIGKGVARKLVGFTLADPSAPCPKECHLVIDADVIAGRVTSAVRSPTLGKVIGLAYVPPASAEVGRRFAIRIEGGRMIEAEVASTPFYDPENARQEM